MVNGKATIVNADACNYCTDCEAACPAGAIQCAYMIVLKRRQG